MSSPAIPAKDISVIVRGLVVGAHDHDPQKRFTERCIRSIRHHLPEAEVIFSTWTDQDTTGLDLDTLVVNGQPEPVYMTHPSGEVRQITTNNQIITSHAGIEYAARPYILNIRSDIELYGTRFIDLFRLFNKGESQGHFTQKLVVLPTYNPRRGLRFLFDVCDWFYFGLREDVHDLFNIPLMNKSDLKGTLMNGYPPVEDNLGCEAYIWTHFLEKHGEQTIPNQRFFSEKAMRESERSYAQNTIMAPATKLQITCLKMPHAGYGARPWLSQGLYTFAEYKYLHNRYNTPNLLIIPNPVENLAYSIALTLRRKLSTVAPNFYIKVVNFIRKRYGSVNFLK